MANINVLVSFNGSNGDTPVTSLVADAAGNLFGTTQLGGAYGAGAVFEIAKTAGGYATVATTLVSFNDYDGASPSGGLVIDAQGDLFGTTSAGGTNSYGTVFELPKAGNGYASSPTTLVNFNGSSGANPFGNLTIDPNGDLIGLTQAGGTWKDGTVFEVAKTGSGYAPTENAIYSFDNAVSGGPGGTLIEDAAGDLFGTTAEPTPPFGDTVFEIPRITGGGFSGLTVLGTFSLDMPLALMLDGSGNLFGTTDFGGTNDDGALYEIGKSVNGYGSPVTLASFNGSNGSGPNNLFEDTKGNLFGTSNGGGANNDGAVFEIARTSGGYTGPTLLASFAQTNGVTPNPGLVVDAAGNVLGTAEFGGLASIEAAVGSVFEVTGVVASSGNPPIVSLAASPTSADGQSVTLGTATAGTDSDPLQVTLTSDADFPSGSALTLISGTLSYLPGLVTAALAGSDTIKYTVTDITTGATTSETQSVSLTASATYLAVQSSYQGILRAAPLAAYAANKASQITTGQTSLAQIEASLIASEQALYTTEAALVTIDAFYKATPSSALLTTAAAAASGTS